MIETTQSSVNTRRLNPDAVTSDRAIRLGENQWSVVLKSAPSQANRLAQADDGGQGGYGSGRSQLVLTVECVSVSCRVRKKLAIFIFDTILRAGSEWGVNRRDGSDVPRMWEWSSPWLVRWNAVQHRHRMMQAFSEKIYRERDNSFNKLWVLQNFVRESSGNVQCWVLQGSFVTIQYRRLKFRQSVWSRAWTTRNIKSSKREGVQLHPARYFDIESNLQSSPLWSTR